MSTVFLDYVSVRDITATGGATFILGPNSQQVSGDTGFTSTIGVNYVTFRDINATGTKKILAGSNSVNTSGNTGILWMNAVTATATQSSSSVFSREILKNVTTTQAQVSSTVKSILRSVSVVIQSLVTGLKRGVSSNISVPQALVNSATRSITKTANYAQAQVSVASRSRTVVLQLTAIQNFLTSIRTRSNIFTGRGSVNIITDSHPVTSTSRGFSSTINTDGATGSRVFVGKATPSSKGVVPQVGDTWITDPFNGVTSQRPAASIGIGAKWFDVTLGKPIWSNGTVWKDATGTLV